MSTFEIEEPFSETSSGKFYIRMMKGATRTTLEDLRERKDIGMDKLKKQNTRDVKAHLLRSAFYLLLFVGVIVVVPLSGAINMPNPVSKFSTWQDNIAFVKVRESASSLLASATRNNQTLTFAARATYQRAIEEVYWRHRIWPRENPDPKPSLDAVMS